MVDLEEQGYFSKRLSKYIEQEEVCLWVEKQLEENKLPAHVSNISNGSLLCALLAQSFPQSEITMDTIQWELNSSQTFDDQVKCNINLFMNGVKNLLESNGMTKIMENTIQRLEEAAKNCNFDACFEFLKDFSLASLKPSRIRAPGVKASGIPRLVRNGSGIPVRLSKIPRLGQQHSGIGDKENNVNFNQIVNEPAPSFLDLQGNVEHSGKKRPREEPDISVYVTQVTSEQEEETTHAENSQDDIVEEEQQTSKEIQLQQDLKVASCLREDLLRDNAGIKLKIDHIREEIGLYYELLVRMEQTVMIQKEALEMAIKDSDEKRRDLITIQGILEIIGAAKPSILSDELDNISVEHQNQQESESSDSAAATISIDESSSSPATEGEGKSAHPQGENPTACTEERLQHQTLDINTLSQEETKDLSEQKN